MVGTWWEVAESYNGKPVWRLKLTADEPSGCFTWSEVGGGHHGWLMGEVFGDASGQNLKSWGKVLSDRAHPLFLHVPFRAKATCQPVAGSDFNFSY